MSEQEQTRTALIAGVAPDNEFGNFMAALVEREQREQTWIANSLMEGYKGERDRAWAELEAIREQMRIVLARGYMPTETRIMDILYPTDGLIEVYMGAEKR